MSEERIVVIGASAGGVDALMRIVGGLPPDPETMLGAQNEVLEEALWTAVNTLEESARMSRRLGDAEAARGHEWMALRFRMPVPVEA